MIDGNYTATKEGDTLVVHSKIWNDSEDKVGTYMEDTDYDVLVESDMDFYAPDTSLEGSDLEDLVIFKFRKNTFTEEEQIGAYDGLVGAATPTQNRGLAAGPRSGSQGQRDWVTDEQFDMMEHFINGSTATLFDDGVDYIQRIKEKHSGEAKSEARGKVWLRTKIYDSGYEYSTFFNDIVEDWIKMSPSEAAASAEVIRSTYVSDTSYANAVLSGIAGFYDRYPRIPYGRATSYTEFSRAKYEECYPFMRRLSEKFEKLLPKRFKTQTECANQLDDRYRVAGKDTPFTTITVNKNFRTAAHRDAGDLTEGFSNLTVVARDKEWEGGYLVLPEFRVAINIRPGDLLLINNHAGIHGNTEMRPPAGKTIEDMERISLVCYFRENMLMLGSKEYEDTRRAYVDSRRLNKDHVLWKKLWNGISSNMWDEQEWYSYLEAAMGVDTVAEYHPLAYEEKTTLEGFF